MLFRSAASTLNNGIGFFAANLKTTGNQTIIATDKSNSNITGTSNSILVTASASFATHFVVSAPSSVNSGSDIRREGPGGIPVGLDLRGDGSVSGTYIVESLPRREMLAVGEHLEACVECAQALALLRAGSRHG